MNDTITQSIDESSEQLVVFNLAGELYGVNIASVNTIIRMQDITQIPNTHRFIEGVINLRGSIIPVINLRSRFKLPEADATKASRIVVVEAGGQLIGMTVDAVAETMRFSAHDIEPPSPVIASIDAEYLRGVGKSGDLLVILLDLDKVLVSSKLEMGEAMAA